MKQIQTKNLWESSLNLISFCSLSENFFFFFEMLSATKETSSTPSPISLEHPSPPYPGGGGGEDRPGLLRQHKVHLKPVNPYRQLKIHIYSFLIFRDCFNERVSRDESDKALFSLLPINTFLNIRQANPHRKGQIYKLIGFYTFPYPSQGLPVHKRWSARLYRSMKTVSKSFRSEFGN